MEVDAVDPPEPDADLLNMSTADLIEKIRKLKLHVKQLRNVIHKSATSSAPLSGQSSQDEEPSRKKVKKERPFNFDMCDILILDLISLIVLIGGTLITQFHPRRHVALKVAYLGWDLQGLASQEDTEDTIEGHLFNGLQRTRLIQSRETSNYHRCGRTDKGVSAFDQVLSLDLRCKSMNGIGVKPPVFPRIDGVESRTESEFGVAEDEINYSFLLNRVLPKEIRVLAWAPVHDNFSARYDCVQRTYKYFFPKHQLNTKLMLEAAQSLIGVHDFRNFCKLDSSGRKTTVREILGVSLEEIDSEWGIVGMVIKGRSFIWHQIRCIISILFLVGQGLEEPSIVSTLLDINTHPKKPQYPMAVDFPLVLFDVDHGEIPWVFDENNLSSVRKDWTTIAMRHKLKASIIDGMLRGINRMPPSATSGVTRPHKEDDAQECVDWLVMGMKPKVYRPLLSRPVNEKWPEIDQIN